MLSLGFSESAREGINKHDAVELGLGAGERYGTPQLGRVSIQEPRG